MAYPSDLVRTKNWGTEILTDSDLEGQFDLIINWVMAALNSTTGHAHDGTSNQGPKLSIASALTIASQAQGDIIYASSSSAWARLGAGTNGQFLKTQGAAANPVWADVAFQTAASQAEMEAASSNTVPVTPGRLQYHPGVAKAWAKYNGTGTPALTVSHNVDASITDNGTGDYTFSVTTDFSSANHVCIANSDTASTDEPMIVSAIAQAAGTVRIKMIGHGGGASDTDFGFFALFGDQ